MIYVINVIYLQHYLISVNIIYFTSKIWLLYQLQDIFFLVSKSTGCRTTLSTSPP